MNPVIDFMKWFGIQIAHFVILSCIVQLGFPASAIAAAKSLNCRYFATEIADIHRQRQMPTARAVTAVVDNLAEYLSQVFESKRGLLSQGTLSRRCRERLKTSESWDLESLVNFRISMEHSDPDANILVFPHYKDASARLAMLGWLFLQENSRLGKSLTPNQRKCLATSLNQLLNGIASGNLSQRAFWEIYRSVANADLSEENFFHYALSDTWKAEEYHFVPIVAETFLSQLELLKLNHLFLDPVQMTVTNNQFYDGAERGVPRSVVARHDTLHAGTLQGFTLSESLVPRQYFKSLTPENQLTYLRQRANEFSVFMDLLQKQSVPRQRNIVAILFETFHESLNISGEYPLHIPNSFQFVRTTLQNRADFERCFSRDMSNNVRNRFPQSHERDLRYALTWLRDNLPGD